MSIRILLADDQPLLRHGFRLILSAEADMDVVGEAGTGQEARRLTRQLRSGCGAHGRSDAAHGRHRGNAPDRRRTPRWRGLSF